MQGLLDNNRKGYGPRAEFKSLRDYFQESKVDKKELKKYYLEADMFDPRLEALEDTFRFFEGKPAYRFLVDLQNEVWMQNHKLAEAKTEKLKMRTMIKDLFIAIDED